MKQVEATSAISAPAPAICASSTTPALACAPEWTAGGKGEHQAPIRGRTQAEGDAPPRSALGESRCEQQPTTSPGCVRRSQSQKAAFDPKRLEAVRGAPTAGPDSGRWPLRAARAEPAGLSARRVPYRAGATPRAPGRAAILVDGAALQAKHQAGGQRRGLRGKIDSRCKCSAVLASGRTSARGRQASSSRRCPWQPCRQRAPARFESGVANVANAESLEQVAKPSVRARNSLPSCPRRHLTLASSVW
jgi:hypothetical protein